MFAAGLAPAHELPHIMKAVVQMMRLTACSCSKACSSAWPTVHGRRDDHASAKRCMSRTCIEVIHRQMPKKPM